MDERDVVCLLCRWGGKTERNSNGEIRYIGGVTEGFVVTSTMTYESFVEELRQRSSLDLSGKFIYFTIGHNKHELARMRDDCGFRAMLLANNRIADIYVEDAMSVPVPCPITSCNSTSASSNCYDAIGSTSPPTPNIVHHNSFPHVEDITCEGQLFESPDDFKDALMMFALRNHFRFKYVDNSRKYYRVFCVVKGCQWKLTAGCEGKCDTVRIKRFIKVHTHKAQDILEYKPVIKSKEMGRIFANKVWEKPGYAPKEICKDIESDFSIGMTYMQGWRAKEHASRVIEGCPEDGYILVPWLCQRLSKDIPGTITSWDSTDDKRIKRVFVAYGCSIRGFLGYCRPILSIEACHLSGNYKGTMLCATGLDANEGLWPLAYAIVSSENDEDWFWFLSKVRDILDNRTVTILTDKHPSWISAVRELFGSHCHSWCLRHLMDEFSRFIDGRTSLRLNGSGKETAKQILNNIAYARTEYEYKNAMAMMAAFRVELRDWVLENSPEHWSNAKFPSRRWDKLLVNQTESFNAWVQKERIFSIKWLMEEHMRRLTIFLYKKKVDVEKWTIPVGNCIEKKIKDCQGYALGFSLMRVSHTECTVFEQNGRPFKVVLKPEPYCSCLGWTMIGIPCSHACFAIEKYSLNIYDMVDSCFKVETQQKLCDHLMSSVAMHDMPDVPRDEGEGTSAFIPPMGRRPVGRPRVRRIESQLQSRRQVHCSPCGETGHNRRNCKAPIPY